MITNDDFVQWKNNPVTGVFHEVVKDRIREAEEVLGRTAGIDSGQDRFMVGFVHALKEVLEFSVEGVDEA